MKERRKIPRCKYKTLRGTLCALYESKGPFCTIHAKKVLEGKTGATPLAALEAFNEYQINLADGGTPEDAP